MIYLLTYYDSFRQQKTVYCVGTELQATEFVSCLPDANQALIVKQADIVLVKPTGYINIVDCSGCGL